MTTLIQIDNTPASKKLIDFLKTMSFVKIIETNKETMKAMQDVKHKKVNSYKSAKDLFKKLDA